MNEYIRYVTTRKMEEGNPQNVPQARQIENFWACLCEKVYQNGWKATTQKESIKRIERKLKDFDLYNNKIEVYSRQLCF